MSLHNNFNWDGIAGTTTDVLSGSEGSSDAAGDLTEAGLHSVLSSVPFVGGILATLSTKLNISKNVSLVFKYGFSSWGASTSPEKAKADFVKFVYPYYKDQLTSITPDNMGQVLTDLSVRLKVNQEMSMKMRKYNSNAKSTKLAHDWEISEFKSLLSGIDTVISGLKSKNVSVEVSSVKKEASSLGMTWIVDGRNITNTDVINTPVSLNRYVIDPDSVRALQVKTDENGNVIGVESSGGFAKLLTYGGFAFAAFKAFK